MSQNLDAQKIAGIIQTNSNYIKESIGYGFIDVECTCNETKQNLGHLIAIHGDDSLIKTYLEYMLLLKEDNKEAVKDLINLKDIDGNTILHYVIKNKKLSDNWVKDTIMILGADPMIENNNNEIVQISEESEQPEQPEQPKQPTHQQAPTLPWETQMPPSAALVEGGWSRRPGSVLSSAIAAQSADFRSWQRRL